MNKDGVKYTYSPEFAAQARKLCELGATDADLAEFFKAHRRTIILWRSTHAEFGEACKVGKEKADDRVERSLYQRALGCSYEAQKVVVVAGVAQVVDYIENCPPDTAACALWLKNRCGWRDTYDHKHSGTDASRLTDEALEAIAAGGSGATTATPPSKGKPH